MNSRELHINDMPNEVLLHIFTFLPHLENRKPLSLVCRRWNDLAFSYNYLGQIMLKLTILTTKNIRRQHKISRYYRIVVIGCHFNLKFDECETQKLLTWFEKPASSVQEFVCNDSSRNFPTLKLLSICRNVTKVQIHSDRDVPDDELPVLKNLEELFIDTKRINIIHLAPNLRRLRVSSMHRDLPMVIRKLSSLKQLRVDFLIVYIDLFQKCTEVTKLTAVDLLLGRIDQKGLEQLCEFCPLLIKLRINVIPTTVLRCLARLTHFKVLSLHGVDTKLFANNDVCLSNVKILEFNIRENLHFDRSVQRMFPAVNYLKFGYDSKIKPVTDQVSDGFPQLRTLEISRCGSADLFDRLIELANLRELIARDSQLSDNYLAPVSLPQLTLKNSDLEVTHEMAENLPNLLFLNLFGNSRYTNAEKLPSKCTVRRYLRDCIKHVFYIV